jgi:hypothetical protein
VELYNEYMGYSYIYMSEKLLVLLSLIILPGFVTIVPLNMKKIIVRERYLISLYFFCFLVRSRNEATGFSLYLLLFLIFVLVFAPVILPREWMFEFPFAYFKFCFYLSHFFITFLCIRVYVCGMFLFPV